MKSRDGKSQRGEEKRRRKKINKRKSEKTENPGARKGRKVAKHCVFPMICAKSRLQQKCTPLWREAHFQVKMYKTHQVRTTFGSWDVEKVHAVVARSTFRSQNVQITSAPERFWKLRCRKSARRCGAKHILKSKVLKNCGIRSTLDVQMWFRVAGVRDCAPCQEWAKRKGFLSSISKNDGRRGTFDEDLQRCIFRGGRSTRDMFIRAADFLREVAFWSIRSSGLLRWFCLTGAALPMTWHYFFGAGAVL